MEKLRNGATLLHRTPVAADHNVVLAYSDGSYHPYITWLQDARTGECVVGHYFPDFFTAVEDYRSRIGLAGGHIKTQR